MQDPLHDTLATFGNSSIIGGFLKHYEDEIERRGEEKEPLSCAPNYYAWLLVASENIWYSVRQLIFFKSKATASDIFDESYAGLLERLTQVVEISPETEADLLLFLKIRHLMVHKGFPNLHDVPSRRARTLVSGVLYTYGDVQEVRSSIMKPSDFQSLREQFNRAGQSLSKLQGPIEMSF